MQIQVRGSTYVLAQLHAFFTQLKLYFNIRALIFFEISMVEESGQPKFWRQYF